MADVALASILDIDQGLGVHPSLRQDAVYGSNGTGNGGTSTWVDESRRSQRKNMLAELLGPVGWQLHNQLGANDYQEEGSHSVTVNYAIEMVANQLSRGAVQSKRTPYAVVSQSEKPCKISHKSYMNTTSTGSAAASTDELNAYAGGINSYTAIGLGQEAYHSVLVKQGSDLTSVYVRMWLVHLSIRASSSITVTVNHDVLRQALGNVPSDHECEAAKRLSGVRICGRGLSNEVLALLVVGCSQLEGLTGLHRRASRYLFPVAKLTCFGDGRRGTVATELRDASVTGAAIVSLAARFGHYDQCGIALRTALTMFGVPLAGRHICLECQSPVLHDGVHGAPYGIKEPFMRCAELSDRRILSLSLFVGRAWRQVFGHVLRSTALSMGATDVDAVADTVLAHHRQVLIGAGNAHKDSMSGFSTAIDAAEYCLRHCYSLWMERGFVHSLMMGVLVKGSVADEATAVIDVPIISALHPPDDPSAQGPADAMWDRITLLQGLLDDCGDALRGSGVSRGDELGAVVSVSPSVMQLCGNAVRLTILGLGGSVEITRNEASGFSYNPSAETSVTYPHRTYAERTALEETVNSAPVRPEEADIEGLWSQYAPSGSLMRRIHGGERRTTTLPESTGDVVVTSGSELETIRGAAGAGYRLQPTSGEGIICGANALQISLEQVGARVTNDEVLNAVRGALNRDEVALIESAGIQVTDHNFTADQLARGLSALGRYALVVVSEDAGGVTAYRVSAGLPDEVPVVVYHRGAHWQGVGTAGSGRRITASERSRRV